MMFFPVQSLLHQMVWHKMEWEYKGWHWVYYNIRYYWFLSVSQISRQMSLQSVAWPVWDTQAGQRDTDNHCDGSRFVCELYQLSSQVCKCEKWVTKWWNLSSVFPSNHNVMKYWFNHQLWNKIVRVSICFLKTVNIGFNMHLCVE